MLARLPVIVAAPGKIKIKKWWLGAITPRARVAVVAVLILDARPVLPARHDAQGA
jgi:hypothetical protein